MFGRTFFGDSRLSGIEKDPKKTDLEGSQCLSGQSHWRHCKSATPNTKIKSTNSLMGGGLYLLVTPSGGKLWRLKYRFGDFPEVSLSVARQKREEANGQVAQGIDTGVARKKKKAAEIRAQATFEAVVSEWHCLFLSKWAPGTAKAILKMLTNNVFREIGDKPISGIDAPMLLDMLRRIEARGANYTAHRVRGLCGHIFRTTYGTFSA